MAFALEMRNTADWNDCRFRQYTTSAKKAENFRLFVTKIQFTDSGHGLVATVHETKRGDKRLPAISTQAEHVRNCLAAAEGRQP